MSNTPHDHDLDRYAEAISDLRAACREHVTLLKRMTRPGRGGVPKDELRRTLARLETAIERSIQTLGEDS